jgi:OmpA-OmpF porin, OOP family
MLLKKIVASETPKSNTTQVSVIFTLLYKLNINKMNLLDLVKGQLTSGNTLDMISGLLGENAATTKTGIGAALPTLLGSVIQSGSTTSGAASLLNLIKDGGHNGGIMDNLGSLLSGGSATNGLMSAGNGILTSLLGDKLGSITGLIGQVSGMKSGSASSLLSLVAPMLMGSIGKQVSANGLGASGLMSLLAGQSDFVKAALPAGAASLLGFGGPSVSNMASNAVSNISNTATKAATNVSNAVEDTASGFNFWPWLIGAAVLLGGMYAFKTCSAPKVDTSIVDKAVDATKNAASTATDAAANAATSVATKIGDIFKLTLPGGTVLDVPKGSLEDGLVTYIQSNDSISKTKWFDFDRLLFETGKATLKPESAAQMANAAAIMKAFPNVKIKIGGYTDNVGNAASNFKLSGERAKNVMAELVKLGTAATRMEAEGYGDKNPVASNDTKEGQAKNRRISMRVTAK